MKRYCFFDFNINFGGAPKGSINLCRSLSEIGEKIIVYDAYGKNKQYVAFIKKSNLDHRIINPEAKQTYIGGDNFLQRLFIAISQVPDFFRLIIRMRKFFVEDKVSLVWVNNKKSLLITTLATLGMDVKKVIYHRGWAQKKDIDFIYKFLINFFTSSIVAHSHSTVRNLKAIFLKKDIHYVPNSVVISSLRKKSEYAESFFVITLPAARPVREKGHDIALKALHRLVLEGLENILMVFPGEVPSGQSGDYLDSLHRFIDENNLIYNVRFIGWQDSLDDVIESSDIVILPSHTEGFPRVIIESMLIGKPVIATPVGGIPEAIFEGDTGFLIDIDDDEKLAEKITLLYSDEALRNQVSRRAMIFAKDHFNAELQVKTISQVFKMACQIKN